MWEQCIPARTFAFCEHRVVAAAVVPWMILQTAAFIGMVVLLRRTFLPEPGVENLALTLTLALLLPSTLATFGHGQVNFLAVLYVVAAWRTRQKTVSSVYLVGAAILKLLYGELWLYPVLRRQWAPLKGIVAAGTGATLASIAAFGWPVSVRICTIIPGSIECPRTTSGHL
jgi:hypothetical protein